MITNLDNNCTGEDVVSVTQDNTLPTANAGPDGIIDCTNTSYQLDGSNSSGGNLEYAWYNAAGDLLGTNSTLDVTQGGDYTLVITNLDNNCTGEDVVSVTQDNTLPTANAGPDGIIDCTNTSFQLDGNNSSGGNLEYAWYNAAGDLLGTSVAIEVTQGGDYTLVITNLDNNCTGEDVVSVTQDNTLPTANAGPDGIIDCTNTSYQLDGSSSSGGNLEYAWYNAAGDLLGTSTTIEVTQGGDYTLVITNLDNNCTGEDVVSVTQDNTLPTANAGPDGIIDCTNTSYQLDGTNSSGGNLEYAWYNDAGDLLGTSVTLEVTQGGDYTLVITNLDNNCSGEDIVSVTQDAALPTADAGPDGIIDCTNTSYQLDGSNSSGGNLEYAWYNAAGDLLGTSATIEVTQGGDYTLVITNLDNNCSGEDIVSVTQDAALPTADAGPDGIIDCTNTSYQLDGSNSSGGNLAFAWYNAAGDLLGTSVAIEVNSRWGLYFDSN